MLLWNSVVRASANLLVDWPTSMIAIASFYREHLHRLLLGMARAPRQNQSDRAFCQQYLWKNDEKMKCTINLSQKSHQTHEISTVNGTILWEDRMCTNRLKIPWPMMRWFRHYSGSSRYLSFWKIFTFVYSHRAAAKWNCFALFLMFYKDYVHVFSLHSNQRSVSN